MFEFIDVDEALKSEWMQYSKWSKRVNEEVIRIKDGFSIIAKLNGELAGIISVYYKNLFSPLADTKEAYIDNIEIRTEFRKQGIATALIQEVITRIKENKDIYQIRAWSSEDKAEMIHLWKKLQFTLHSAIIHPTKDLEVKGFYVAKKL